MAERTKMMIGRQIASWTDQLWAFLKFCLSFRKENWELSDYPVRIRRQQLDPNSEYASARFKQHDYVARIVNWHMSGGGDSKSEAISNLRRSWEEARDKKRIAGAPLPRPGKRVAIEFASRNNVARHAELEQDFIHRILGLEWAWISDESSLWHFHSQETNEYYLEKIREAYGVDVTDIESGYICEILDRIAESRRLAVHPRR